MSDKNDEIKDENKEEKSKPPSTLKIVVKSIYLLIMVIYAIYGMVMAILAYIEFSDITAGFGNIIDNWRQDVVTNVQTISDSSCPSNFEPLETFIWPGIAQGCDCTVESGANQTSLKNFNLTSSLEKGKCDSNQTKVGCRDVSSISRKTLSLWKDGRQTCIQREKGIDFIEQAENMQDNGECRSGGKLCGASPSDPKFGVCIDSSKECPYTKFVVDSSNPDTDMYEEIGLFHTGFNLYATRQTNTSVLAEFRISSES